MALYYKKKKMILVCQKTLVKGFKHFTVHFYVLLCKCNIELSSVSVLFFYAISEEQI